MEVKGLYRGKSKILQPSGEASGIFKEPVSYVEVDKLGIKGDVQVDRRYHGGPDKALHQYALSSYQRIVAAYAELDGIAVPGSIGENITIGEMTETAVCIGDIYRFGTVLVQVSEPRRPCWKINTKFKQHDLSEFIERERITGWYYRVLEAGEIKLEDTVLLKDRLNPQVNIDHFNAVLNQAKPKRSELLQLLESEGLATYLKIRLEQKSRKLNA